MTRRFTTLTILPMLALGLTGLASADDWRNRDRGRQEGQYGNGNVSDRAYREGYEQGQRDQARNARSNHRNSQWNRGDSSYRDAYRNGYESGYNGGGNYSNNYPYGQDSRSPYPYGNQSGPYGNQSGYTRLAYQQGVEDGRIDGRNDRATGHSYRPTEDGNYKHADRGYNSAYGNKDGYKQEYRSGYLSGYGQGYGRR